MHGTTKYKNHEQTDARVADLSRVSGADIGIFSTPLTAFISFSARSPEPALDTRLPEEGCKTVTAWCDKRKTPIGEPE